MPYSKQEYDDHVAFDVIAEKAPTSNSGIILGIIWILFSFFVFYFSPGIGALLFTLSIPIFLASTYDRRPGEYTQSRYFTVSNGEVSINGKVIQRTEIQRSIVKNPITGVTRTEDLQATTLAAGFLAARSDGAAIGMLAAQGMKPRVEHICFAAIVEHGGAETILGGGLTEAGAHGLLTEMLQALVESIIQMEPVRDDGLRVCPFCAELIKTEAIKCKHCGSEVRPISPSKALVTKQDAKEERTVHNIIEQSKIITLGNDNSAAGDKDKDRAIINKTALRGFVVIIIVSLGVTIPLYYKSDHAKTTKLSEIPSNITQINAANDPPQVPKQWLITADENIKEFISEQEYRLDFINTVHSEAMRADLDPTIVIILIGEVSGYRKYAVSKNGAIGYMQVMPHWVQRIGNKEHNLFHLRTNLRYGCTILRHYLEMERGDMQQALIRYKSEI